MTRSRRQAMKREKSKKKGIQILPLLLVLLYLVGIYNNYRAGNLAMAWMWGILFIGSLIFLAYYYLHLKDKDQ